MIAKVRRRAISGGRGGRFVMDHALCGWREKGNRGGVVNESFGNPCYDTEMMHRMKSSFSLALAALLFAGCGGGGGSGGTGGGNPPVDPRLARLDAYEALYLRVLGDVQAGLPAMTVTAAQDMPVGGTALFSGAATIRVELQSDPLVLYGDAAINVDFGAGQVSGTLQNFFGGTAQDRVADYAGEIIIVGDVPEQNMALSYVGSLSTAGVALGFDGTLAAAFLGGPVTAIAASDLSALVTHNQSTQNATVIVVGEGVLRPADPPDPS